eukprot:COSAG04_NODE_2678_length_3745_cov_7.789358_3_plen_133_part_00
MRVAAVLRAGWMIQEAPDWALQNVASLTQTAVVGSVATGSHGSSGVDRATGRAILSSNSGYVNSVELVCADGSLRTFRRGDPEFGGVVTACGSLGVVSKISLDIVPAFDCCDAKCKRSSSFRVFFQEAERSC